MNERWKAFVEALIHFSFADIIVGSILTGIVTPTKSRCLCCRLCFVSSMFILKSLKIIKTLPRIFAPSNAATPLVDSDRNCVVAAQLVTDLSQECRKPSAKWY